MRVLVPECRRKNPAPLEYAERLQLNSPAVRNARRPPRLSRRRREILGGFVNDYIDCVGGQRE